MKQLEIEKQADSFHIKLGRHHYLKMNAKNQKLKLYDDEHKLLGEFNSIAQANWHLIVNNLL